MINYKGDVLEKINNIDYDNTYVILDFDHTITDGGEDSVSTIGLIAKSGILGSEYADIRKRIYDFYRPIELDLSIKEEVRTMFLKQWLENQICLYGYYGLTLEKLDEIFKREKQLLIPRDGMSNFLKQLHDCNMPVLIISAGLGDNIERFLKQNECYYENIKVISNFLNFENGIVCKTKSDLIHITNKNSAFSNDDPHIKGREQIIAIGDSISDIDMIPNDKKADALKIGFLDEKLENFDKYMEVFDIVCTENTSFNEVGNLIKKKVR